MGNFGGEDVETKAEVGSGVETITVISCARLFEIAPQSGNLTAQGLGSLQITPGEGYGQGKFQFFKLVVTLPAAGGKRIAGRRGWRCCAVLGTTIP